VAREKSATEMSVLMGMDALRICIGMQPVNYRPEHVTRWMGIMIEEMHTDMPAPETSVVPAHLVKAVRNECDCDHEMSMHCQYTKPGNTCDCLCHKLIAETSAVPVRKRENFMPRVNGKPFRCECGCNVFHKDDEGHFICNACETAYEGT
jgi:hypothetical protein